MTASGQAPAAQQRAMAAESKGDAPLLDKKVYENQCAINLSAALIRSGISMNGYIGAWSWEKGKPKYAIRAQELANWLTTPAS